MEDFVGGFILVGFAYYCMILFIILQTIEEKRERGKHKKKTWRAARSGE